MSEDWRLTVSVWLNEPSSRSDDELFEAARNAHSDEGYLKGEAAIREIIHRDRAKARLVLRELALSMDKRVTALALVVLYEDSLRTASADVEDERTSLQTIASDRDQPYAARYWAIQALIATSWTGYEAWFVGLFSDVSLHQLLVQAVAEHPDRLLLRAVADLVGGKNRTAHANAVACLVQFNDSHVRADQSIESLIQILPLVGFQERVAVAKALAFYGDSRAVPALKAVLAVEESRRPLLVEALAACGGLNTDEEARAIEAYAHQTSTKAGLRQWRDSRHEFDPNVSIGAVLRGGRHADDSLTQRLYARADAVEGTDPATSRTLRRLLARWPYPAVAARIVDAIRTRTANLETITAALEQRSVIAEHAREALRELVETQGDRKGIAAAFLGDTETHQAILDGTDREAQTALLACARLNRTPLRVASVGSLLGAGPHMARKAAEAYLIAEDSPTARSMVRAHRPEEWLLLGSPDERAVGPTEFRDLTGWARQLVVELRRDAPPDQIIALLSYGNFGDDGQRIVYVRGGTSRIRRSPREGSLPATGAYRWGVESLKLVHLIIPLFRSPTVRNREPGRRRIHSAPTDAPGRATSVYE